MTAFVGPIERLGKSMHDSVRQSVREGTTYIRRYSGAAVGGAARIRISSPAARPVML